MIRLFLTDEGIVTNVEGLEAEEFEVATVDMLEDLNYVGDEDEEYRLTNGIYAYNTKEMVQAILEDARDIWGAETDELINSCTGNWVCIKHIAHTPIWQELQKQITEAEELASVNFNDSLTYAEIVTKVKKADLKYVYNLYQKENGTVQTEMVMLH
ncbi:hypothetical protein SAMN02745248_00604 [Hathewaya proteolytica DSM 3090]|uniref:Uncharacterized protein n=1 Tax=Hathewaya proteolytica DSM 3090 TaxID=1121331 RepID=A0A1M6L307_9CLOT|nr:hypothetical protein [Hathewaya proteolytica]SHJ65618.1 hypothetical protein SAMN02745248_00604 [Hathewaya proteolytica DSM 3090]